MSEPVEVTAVHVIITPDCRRNRGITGAWIEALARVAAEYEAMNSVEANAKATYHLRLTKERMACSEPLCEFDAGHERQHPHGQRTN